MVHSAMYSTETMHPTTLQYMSHRSSSGSDAGRFDNVLKLAYAGYAYATVELDDEALLGRFIR